MESFDRRKFLKGSTVAAGIAGAMTVVPGALPALAKTEKARSAGSKAQSAGSRAISSSGQSAASEPVVLHVRDARTGQIDLFIGTKQVSVSDRALTQRILDAAS
jgi:hypothetical protein